MRCFFSTSTMSESEVATPSISISIHSWRSPLKHQRCAPAACQQDMAMGKGEGLASAFRIGHQPIGFERVFLIPGQGCARMCLSSFSSAESAPKQDPCGKGSTTCCYPKPKDYHHTTLPTSLLGVGCQLCQRPLCSFLPLRIGHPLQLRLSVGGLFIGKRHGSPR